MLLAHKPCIFVRSFGNRKIFFHSVAFFNFIHSLFFVYFYPYIWGIAVKVIEKEIKKKIFKNEKNWKKKLKKISRKQNPFKYVMNQYFHNFSFVFFRFFYIYFNTQVALYVQAWMGQYPILKKTREKKREIKHKVWESKKKK